MMIRCIARVAVLAIVLAISGVCGGQETYGRGPGHAPDIEPCEFGQRDDNGDCWIDAYGRGAGRIPDKAPCPSGLRDDGTSCWSDAHIYGKGCCCTLWGCCGNCQHGYHDDGCTCRKVDVGIKVTLFERQVCKDDEEKYLALCYPKCIPGYHPFGCCLCHPDGGSRIAKTFADRNPTCQSDEELFGKLCYPKCREGFHSEGCCVCST